MTTKQKLNKKKIYEILSALERGDRIPSIQDTQNISRSNLYKLKKLLETQSKEQIASRYPNETPPIEQLVETLENSNTLSEVCESLGLKSRQLEYLLKKHDINFSEILNERARQSNTKQCSDCKIQKPKGEFYTASFESRDGLSNYCKECFLKRQKVTKAKNWDNIKKRQREYGLRIRKENPELFLNHRKRYATSAKGMFNKLKKSEKTRPNIELRISIEEFSKWFHNQGNQCEYCRIDLKSYQELVTKTELWMLNETYSFGTDRMDSNGHYEIGNIVICCPLCNYLKGYVFSHGDFKEIAKEYVVPFWEDIQ